MQNVFNLASLLSRCFAEIKCFIGARHALDFGLKGFFSIDHVLDHLLLLVVELIERHLVVFFGLCDHFFNHWLVIFLELRAMVEQVLETLWNTWINGCGNLKVVHLLTRSTAEGILREVELLLKRVQSLGQKHVNLFLGRQVLFVQHLMNLLSD